MGSFGDSVLGPGQSSPALLAAHNPNIFVKKSLK